MRFRKRIRLLPGVHINLSGSGASVSLGPRGATVSIGRNGTYGNVSIPGTGLYARKRLSGSGRTNAVSSDDVAAETTSLPVSISLQDDGALSFSDEDGYALSPDLEKLLKKQRGQEIRKWMEEEAAGINALAGAIGNIHIHTPPPDTEIEIPSRKFGTPPPKRPESESMHWLKAMFLRKKKREMDTQNEAKMVAYQSAMKLWGKLEQQFKQKEIARIAGLQSRLKEDVSFMEEFLVDRLEDIEWPRETLVDYSIDKNGRSISLDVDLPEIEDMPTKQASVLKRGWKISIKAISDRQNRVNYMRHVHGIAFRIVGEVFSLLPTIDTVVISGYSQRNDPKTGQAVDHYLYSIRVSRSSWSGINFENLFAVDPIQALEAFELRRQMTKTGIFKPIEPFQ